MIEMKKEKIWDAKENNGYKQLASRMPLSKLPKSKFVSPEKMALLIEKLIKKEEKYKKYSREDCFANKKRENTVINELYFVALKEGLNGEIWKYAKKGIIIGTTLWGILTNFDAESLIYTMMFIGSGSFTIATLTTYKQIKEEAKRIKDVIMKYGNENKITEKNINENHEY